MLAGSGGPGCSSLAGGFLSELGPYYPTNEPGRLQRNEFAWTQAANVIFLESPAFVGWSYSNTTADAVVGAPLRRSVSHSCLAGFSACPFHQCVVSRRQKRLALCR